MEKVNLFKSGFEMVLSGKINRELTASEISRLFPKIEPLDAPAFSNGICDALENDFFRYNLTIEK